MEFETPQNAWQSSFMPQGEEGAQPEKGNVLSTLLVAIPIGVAVVKCLMEPDAPFPLTFCLFCALLALCGLLLSAVLFHWHSSGSLVKALIKRRPLCLLLAIILLSAGLVAHLWIIPSLSYEKHSQNFKSLADHVDYIQANINLPQGRLAWEDLKNNHTKEEIDKAFFQAEIRAQKTHNYTGKGFFFAKLANETIPDASITLKNETQFTLEFICKGPVERTITIKSLKQETFNLPAGDYNTAIAAQGDYQIVPLTAPKRILPHTVYEGTVLSNGANRLVPYETLVNSDEEPLAE